MTMITTGKRHSFLKYGSVPSAENGSPGVAASSPLLPVTVEPGTMDTISSPNDVIKPASPVPVVDTLEEISTTKVPVKPLNQIDKLLDELKEAEDIDISQLEQLVLKICALIHHSEKKFTKELSTSYEKAREYHVQEVVNKLRGRTAVVMTSISSGLHIAAGLGGLAPHSYLSGVDTFNETSRKICGATPFDQFLKAYRNTDKFGEIASIFERTFSGFGRATDGAHGIYNDRRNSAQTYHQAGADNCRLNKEETNQTSQQDGHKADSLRQQAKDLEEKRHNAIKEIMRG